MVFSSDKIQWGMSWREDGPMKLVTDGVFDEGAAENRKRFFAVRGINAGQTVIADLVHGNHVAAVALEDGGRTFAKTDALITAAPGIVLTVTVADCAPVYVFDKKLNAV